MSTIEAVGLTPDGGDGLSFQQVIAAARRLDDLSCARVVGQIADAVHVAQKGGQPLGTVTPAAIVVAADGSVRLAPAAPATGYTAPEKLRGGPGDRRADVFSLGVVLWEALAHERLFDGANDDAVRRAVLAGAVRPPSEHNANVPAELDAICQRALAAEPANRYQSAKVMAAEIDAVLGDAGYPESNEAIASYVARALAPEASKPAPGSKTAPLPATGPAPAPRPASKTLQPLAPTSFAAPRTSAPPAAAARSAQPTEPPLSSTIQSTPRSAKPTEPPAKTAAPASAGTLRSSSATQPPPVTAPAPASTRPSSASQSPVSAVPPIASASAASATSTSSVWTSPTGTSPSPFIANRPPAQTVTVGSWTEPEPATVIDAKAPAWDDGPVKTEVRGSMYPAAGAAHPPAKSSLASTAFLGSNAIATPGGTHVGVPPALVTPAPPIRPTPSDGELPSFAPPEMPAPHGAPPPSDPKRGLPAPFRPSHPQPPIKDSIATAATAETPHLGAEALPAFAVSTQLGLAPGMMVAPAAPSKALPTADNEFEDERHADPAEVVALPHPEKGRDVLAGWGWSTGAVATIPETDDEDIHDTTRAGRKRLVVTIGAAIAVVAVIAVVAFAFRGSKPASDGSVAQASPTAVSATSAPTRATPTPVAPPPSPGSATPSPATTPSATGEPRSGSDVAPAIVADPPTPAVVDPAKPVAADPAKTVVVDPPKPVTDPARPGIDPARPITDPPRPVTDPSRTAAADPAKTVVATPRAIVADPAKTVVATPPKPVVADPPKAVVATKPAAKHDPPKVAVTKPPEAAKPPTHKPVEPKKPVDAVKHTPAPDRVARAPVDPYGAPDKPKADPAAAYKSGLQQYARGDTSGALATFRGSLSSSPGYAPTWRGLGLVYEKLGNKGQARSAFKRYLQLSPGASDADQIRDRLERLGS
ncbi:MAG: hypothetical protein ABIY55_21065 [Kofleriaceae bacterium]